MIHSRLRWSIVLSCLLVPGLPVLAQQDSVLDLRDVYGKFHGSFSALETATGRTLHYAPAICAQRFSPASTFKIPNSLIALETGVLRDRETQIPWDSVPRALPAWNRTHTLASAVANSVVWYFQEVARRVGVTRMRHLVDTLGYGNRKVQEPVDQFWLDGSLRISADEQVRFLQRLREGTLPLSARSQEITRGLIILDSSAHGVLRGKTGFTEFGADSAVTWFVGWVEKDGNALIYASCMVTGRRHTEGEEMFDRRKTLALAVLRRLGWIK